MAGAKRGRWEAIFTLAANKTITFTDTSGADVVTITAGDYTITSLVAFIDAELDADWTITFSGGESGTGKITISSGLVNFDVAWGDTTTRALMGFTGDISGASSAQTGTQQCRTVWLPGTEKWTPHGDETTTGGSSAATPMVATSQSIGPTGNIKTLCSSSVIREYRGVRYEGVLRARAKLIGESVVNESFERFWLDTQKAQHAYCSAPGAKIRLYWDADDTFYTTVRIVGLNEYDPVKPNPNWVGRYNIEIPRLVVQS